MNGDRIFGWAIGTLVVAFAAFVFYALVKTTLADGEVSYCYVEMEPVWGTTPQYHLYGSRPWRPDVLIGAYPTLEEATKHAEDMKCPLNKR